ncbi:MAG: hypothetical protein HC794_04320 [Nitrospiraceae bacterium]|nr:hypothetical protein [Nitrospiraceae bacterium]
MPQLDRDIRQLALLLQEDVVQAVGPQREGWSRLVRLPLFLIASEQRFGIELATAARVAFKSAGFELALDKTYPIGTQDMQALLKDAIIISCLRVWRLCAAVAPLTLMSCA